MRITLIVATFVASVLAIFAAIDLHAQGRGPAPGVHCPVAVIDIAYILKKHDGFNQAVVRMKQELQAADNNMKKDRDHMLKMQETLKTLKPGTPDYKKLDEEMTELVVNVQTHMQIQKKEFQEREAKLYYQVWLEINDAVKYWADRNGVNLVLQFSGDPTDPNNPDSIRRTVQSLVVYQRGVDITPIILDEVNRAPAGGPAGPTARKPTGTNTR